MKKILLFGAGKSATVLIHFLAAYCQKNNHEFIVCDQDLRLAESKINGFSTSRASNLDVTNETARQAAISNADIVISLLPPALHILVARDCLRFYKDLLTASYVDEELLNLSEEIQRRGILFLSEMGLDPGIDHMSAMHIIDRLKAQDARIISFHSHCGGLVAPESDDNPWHYKITWNPRNVVMAGMAGARYLKDGREEQVDYKDIFGRSGQVVNLPGVGELAWYANRDSLSYLHTYGLQGLSTFIRTTLRYPSYNKAWNLIVQLDLASPKDNSVVDGCRSVAEWFQRKKQIFSDANPGSHTLKLLDDPGIKNQFDFLRFYSDTAVRPGASSADILQSLLESRLVMEPQDKDMIVMIHEVEYELQGRRKKLSSSLLVKGTDSLHTAMAKTVGTPLAVAATQIIEGKISLSGLHIPVIPAIYNVVLPLLEDQGISFAETVEDVD